MKEWALPDELGALCRNEVAPFVCRGMMAARLVPGWVHCRVLPFRAATAAPELQGQI